MLPHEPVAKNSGVAVFLMLFAPLFARYGVDAEGAEQIASYLATILLAAAAIWRIIVARSRVRPISKDEYSPGIPPGEGDDIDDVAA